MVAFGGRFKGSRCYLLSFGAVWRPADGPNVSDMGGEAKGAGAGRAAPGGAGATHPPAPVGAFIPAGQR